MVFQSNERTWRRREPEHGALYCVLQAAIEARIPTAGRASLEMMLSVQSPGEYARDVKALSAHTPAGTALAVLHPRPNHWVVATVGADTVVLEYELLCQRASPPAAGSAATAP